MLTTGLLATGIVGNRIVGTGLMTLKKGGGNWVEGERFFDRELDLEALEERVRDGNHTLLTAQRRMGKTSLVRELLRRLEQSGDYDTIFADLEAAASPADAIAEIGVQARPVRGAWDGIKAGFVNFLQEAGDRVEELSIADTRVKLRAGIDAGNWSQRGDTVFTALAANERPIVLAIDELPILVNRLLKNNDGVITTAGKQETDAFLSWLRKHGQASRDRVSMILAGSIGLEPLLEQAGLSAHANIFSPYDLKPWDQDMAASCLAALAETYGIDLHTDVRHAMCRHLRCCIPHHVQMFFDKMHEHLRHAHRQHASLADVRRVYQNDMLGVRGQIDLQHYESRLDFTLGRAGYVIALEILTATAVEESLSHEVVDRYHVYFAGLDQDAEAGAPSFEDVLHVLEHDGYLERTGGGYRFASGLLGDWWRGRYGQNFTPVIARNQFGPGRKR